jgi:hypothetical protein
VSRSYLLLTPPDVTASGLSEVLSDGLRKRRRP